MKLGVLILAILMVVRPVVPVLEYAINYDYISKVLCINKMAPEKKCNGKCHLKENLKCVFDDTASGSSSSKSLAPVEIIAMFSQVLPVFDFSCTICISEQLKIPVQKDMHINGYSSECFHPPVLLV